MLKKPIIHCLLLLTLLKPATSLSLPRPQGYVSDLANIISPSAQAKIEAILANFEQTTGVETAILTLGSLNGRPIEDIATETFETWGIGKKGKDNGLLIVVAPKERKVRIEVGYGLEGIINDASAGRIIRQFMIPHFRKGDFESGLLNGTLAILARIAKQAGVSFEANQNIAQTGYHNRQIKAISHKGASCARGLVSLMLFILFIPFFIRHPFLALFLLSSMGGGRMRGGFGGGFGGFGGFGGGLSGGGGATSSW